MSKPKPCYSASGWKEDDIDTTITASLLEAAGLAGDAATITRQLRADAQALPATRPDHGIPGAGSVMVPEREYNLLCQFETIAELADTLVAEMGLYASCGCRTCAARNALDVALVPYREMRAKRLEDGKRHQTKKATP